ncbi:LysR family transcriptional regulator [uncultured Roseibium sp.]|uniref:LysR family transcriptional regulator n=1 Tax=uncultured Roseibium sp. TaxID=1936171 RepID=UPI002604FCD9|nr:LysR family transcriptional regulator [uncultured Roseibium sp.]
MDTLLSLRVFAEVAEHRSFAFVAERLKLSPAMTTKHVQHLETRVGARLLNRNNRNVSLTEAGVLYLASVRPLLEGLAETEAQLSETTLAAKGTLKISMPVWMANPMFGRIMAAYHAENPEVVLDFDLNSKKVNMVEEGIDLALRAAPTLDDGLIARKLAYVDFPLVASPGFLDRFGRPTTFDDLSGAPFLIYSPMVIGDRLRLREYADLPDIRYKLVMQSENETLIQIGVREGMGFTFLPYWLAKDDLATGRLETVLPDEIWPRVPISAIYPDRSYLPAKVRSFLDFLTGPEGLGQKTPPG